MPGYESQMPAKPTSLAGLPPEIVEQIIAKLDSGSPNFLLDFLNVLLALDITNAHNRECFRNIIDASRHQIAVVDFTKPEDRFDTPVLSLLRNYFAIDLTAKIQQAAQLKQKVDESAESLLDVIPMVAYVRVVLVVDDSMSQESPLFQQFHQLYGTLVDPDTSIDVLYCPSVPSGNRAVSCNYGAVSVVELLKQFEELFFYFNSLIMEFRQSAILVNRNFFDILNIDFLMESPHILRKTYTPRCRQVSFPSLMELNMAYLTIDSFIYKILENDAKINLGSTAARAPTRRFVDEVFCGFLDGVEFYLPNLKSMKFYNYNNEETCNFIDLSTLVIKKFEESQCPLRTLFALHSFVNWKMPNLEYFTGHRFKYDESKMSGSTERLKRSLSDNIKLLHEIAMRETSDATPYFRVSLIPKGVKYSKVINWLPSHSPNSFRQTRLNLDPATRFDASAGDEEDDYYDSNNHYAAPSDLSERKKNQSYFNKPILCLKNDTLEKLELQLLTLNKNNKSIYIQGLFLPKLKELVIHNYTTITKRPKISDKQNSIVLLSPTSSNHNRISPVSSTHTVDGISENADMDDIHPIGFSVWNNLTACELIRFSSQQNIMSDKIQPLDMVDKKQINFLFKINNLKENLPRLNLARSFDNFIDERQRYIIV